MFKKQRVRKAWQKAKTKPKSGLADTNPNKTYIQMWMDEGLNSSLIKPMLDDILLSGSYFGSAVRGVRRLTGREDKIKLPNSLMEKVWLQSKEDAQGKKDVGALDLYIEQAFLQSAFVIKKITQPVETINDYLQKRNIDVGAISAIASAQKELPNTTQTKTEREKRKMGLFA